MHAGGAQLYAACGGSLVLAEAGLLDGQEATTHWAYAPLFRQCFPKVTLHDDRILVQTGPGHSVVCSGGASSWQDLALLLDRQVRRHGRSHPDVEAVPLSMAPRRPAAVCVDDRERRSRRRRHPALPDLAGAELPAARHRRRELVRHPGLPKRTFDRRFRAATGYSPLAYIQTLRIEEAKQMLETGSAPVDAVGREVGYEDAASFRRLFRRLAGMAPGDYRRKFQVPSFIGRAAAERKPQRQQRNTKARARRSSKDVPARREAGAPRS